MRLLRLARMMSLGFMSFALVSGIRFWSHSQWSYIMVFVLAGLGFIVSHGTILAIMAIDNSFRRQQIQIHTIGGGGGVAGSSVTYGTSGGGAGTPVGGPTIVAGGGGGTAARTDAIYATGGAGVLGTMWSERAHGISNDGSGSDLPVSSLRYGRDMS